MGWLGFVQLLIIPSLGSFLFVACGDRLLESGDQIQSLLFPRSSTRSGFFLTIFYRALLFSSPPFTYLHHEAIVYHHHSGLLAFISRAGSWRTENQAKAWHHSDLRTGWHNLQTAPESKPTLS